jgi:hypothetical protein
VPQTMAHAAKIENPELSKRHNFINLIECQTNNKFILGAGNGDGKVCACVRLGGLGIGRIRRPRR